MLEKVIGFKALSVILFCLALFVPEGAHADLYMSVSGKVVAADDGAGLPNIKLVLMSQTKGRLAEARTNAQGVFVLRDVPQGMHDILAISEDPFIVSASEPIPVTVPDGKNVVGVGIKLKRGGAIKGRAMTSTGHPIPNVSVLSSTSNATTDIDGYFLLKGISPGEVEIALLPTAVGGKKISVISKVGKVTELGNVVFAVGVESAVQGMVTDALGKPISGAILIAYRNGASGGYTVSSDKGAFFLAGLDPGNYTLHIISYGYKQIKLSDINVPSSSLKIMLDSEEASSSGLISYRFTKGRDKKGNIFTKLLKILSPKEAFAAACRMQSCPDGIWGVVFADVSALIRPVGGAVTITNYTCFSSLARLHVKTSCAGVGPSTDIVGIDGGLGFGACWDTCCSENLLGPSTGPTAKANIGPFKGIWRKMNFSVGNTCYNFAPFYWDAPWPEWKTILSKTILGSFGGSVLFQGCNSVEFNIFEWLCNTGIACL